MNICTHEKISMFDLLRLKRIRCKNCGMIVKIPLWIRCVEWLIIVCYSLPLSKWLSFLPIYDDYLVLIMAIIMVALMLRVFEVILLRTVIKAIFSCYNGNC